MLKAYFYFLLFKINGQTSKNKEKNEKKEKMK